MEPSSTPSTSSTRGRVELDADTARAIASAVESLPGVARLDGGQFGEVAALFPGGRVIGIARPSLRDDTHLKLHVVVDLEAGVPLPQLAASVRAAVTHAWPEAALVDVLFADAD